MVCGNGCPMYHKSHYDIGKCTCHKKQVIVEIIRRSEELSAVKAEQNHQNKGVMDLQDKYDKVVADRDRLKKMIDSIVTDNYKGNIMTHREIAEKLESDGE